MKCVRPHGKWAASCAFLLILFSISILWLRSEANALIASSAGSVAVAMAAVGQPGDELQRAHVVGHEQCVDCHRAEVRHHLQSPHETAYDLLRTHRESPEIAKKIGMKFGDVTRLSSVCIQCHATEQSIAAGGPRVLPGVTCEACHNAAGGEEGWLNRHAVYGTTGARRTDESREHYDSRKAYCRDAGQLTSAEVYGLAQRCFECHIVGNEKLVNEGEHPAQSDRFEFHEKALVESVRHNFHLDQQTNSTVSSLWLDPHWHGAGRTAANHKRVMLVAGFLADLEISLRYVARASDVDGEFFEAMRDRIEDAYDELSDLVEEVEDAGGELPLVQQALEAAEPYRDIDEDEFSLEEDPPKCIAVADTIAELGKKFAAKHDGSKLEALDVD